MFEQCRICGEVGGVGFTDEVHSLCLSCESIHCRESLAIPMRVSLRRPPPEIEFLDVTRQASTELGRVLANPFRVGRPLSIRQLFWAAPRWASSNRAAINRRGLERGSQPLSAEESIALYRLYLRERVSIGQLDALAQVPAIACWCEPWEPCHIDVLREVVAHRISRRAGAPRWNGEAAAEWIEEADAGMDIPWFEERDLDVDFLEYEDAIPRSSFSGMVEDMELLGYELPNGRILPGTSSWEFMHEEDVDVHGDGSSIWACDGCAECMPEGCDRCGGQGEVLCLNRCAGGMLDGGRAFCPACRGRAWVRCSVCYGSGRPRSQRDVSLDRIQPWRLGHVFYRDQVWPAR